ncbi:MAG: NAD(P)-binding protein [bacterium]|nr:NAD(P)-binding protein [Candidatus Colisoma equi]
MEHDAIVAGAGIWGCTLARRLAEAGRKVLVLEKRAAVGGNCRCEIDTETGIEIHAYGSHIFHTKNEKVWSFVNRFAKFNDYRHCVLARTRALPPDADERRRKEVEVENGRVYHLPIGCTLLKEFFGRELKPSELSAADKNAIFEAFIKGYTSKQWGMPPDKVDPSVIKRLKVRDSCSTDYFDDPHQGIPVDGYNALFERMLDHPNIEVETEMTLKAAGTGFRAVRNLGSPQDSFEVDCGAPGVCALPVYYSGPIDALFDYKFGALPWRTLWFETERLPVADYQRNSVVNYPDIGVPYTRIHEFRHYHPESEGRLPLSTPAASLRLSSTVIMREYSKAWKPGDEPYYPINNPESAALLAKYQEEVDRLSTSIPSLHLVIGGRLGGYRYYDMDQAMAAALEVPFPGSRG